MASTELSLAWRNVWRNKRRTALTALALTFSTAVLVFFMSIQLSSYDAAINATCSIYQGHLQLQAKGYHDNPQIHRYLRNITSLRGKVEAISGVQAVSSRGIGFALLSSDSRSYGVQVVGVEPDREAKVSTIPTLVRKGNYLSERDSPEVVLGKTLAENLKVSVGDELTLLGQGLYGSLAVTVLKVKGIFESGSIDIDRGMVEIPLEQFQEVFGIPKGGHVVAVRTKDVASTPSLASVLRNELTCDMCPFPSATVLNWEELSPGLKESIELDMSMGWLFYLSLVVIVVFGVLNSFLMSILERTREFGMLIALGMGVNRISRLVFLEVLLLLLLGVLPGIVFGGMGTLYYGVHGFQIPGTEEVMKVWNLTSAVYPKLSFVSLTLAPSVVFLITLFVVIFPILRVRGLEAVEAMRAA